MNDSIDQILNKPRETSSFFFLMKTLKSSYLKKFSNATLNPIKINEDETLIYKVFYLIFEEKRKTLEGKELQDEDFVKAMLSIPLSIFSAFYKRKLSLYELYRLSDSKDKEMILKHFRDIYTSCDQKRTISKLKLSIYEDLDNSETAKKKLSYLFKMSEFKTPKYLAALIDVLAYKDIRDTLFNSFVTEKNLDIDFLFFKPEANENSEEKDEKSSLPNDETPQKFIERFIEKIINEKYIEKLIQACMQVNITGDIFIKQGLKNSIDNYITEILKESSMIKKYFMNLENQYKSKASNELPKFKETLKVHILGEEIIPTTSYIESLGQSINYKSIDLDKLYNDIFQNNSFIRASKKEIVTRISYVIYDLYMFVIKQQADLYEQKKNPNSNEIKMPTGVLNFVKKIVDDANIKELVKENEDYKGLVDEIYNNGLFQENENGEIIINKESFSMKNISENIRNEAYSILENLKFDNTVSQENKEYLEYVFEKLKEIFQTIKSLRTQPQKITCFTDLIKDLLNHLEAFKIIIMSILSNDVLEKIESSLDKIEFLNLNPTIKKELIRLFLRFIENVIANIQYLLNESKDPASNEKINNFIVEKEKFLLFVGRVLDFSFSQCSQVIQWFKNPNVNVVQKKRIITKSLVRQQ